MVTTHNLGFPRIGAKRELKFALESYWQNKLSEDALNKTAYQLRDQHWQQQSALDIIPVGDFSLYDQVLDMSFTLGHLPKRVRAFQQGGTLDNYFRIARGRSPKDDSQSGIHAGEMTKWFDTNYHYIVPEFTSDTDFKLDTTRLINQVNEAKRHKDTSQLKPVLIGPVTYLWLGKVKDDSDKLLLLERLLSVYRELLVEFANIGVDWVQIDEPVLTTELSQEWQHTFNLAYHKLKGSGVRLLLTTYFSTLEENLRLACNLPVAGLHLDAINGKKDVQPVIDWLPSNKILSLGVIDGRNIWKTDLTTLVDWLEPVQKKLKSRLWLAPSCSLLHVPVDLTNETKLDPDIRSWLAFAQQKLEELAIVAIALNQGKEAVSQQLRENAETIRQRQLSSRVHDAQVKESVKQTRTALNRRLSTYPQRIIKQQQLFNLPLFPTTTIGSFPQTQEIRQARRRYKNNEISESDYIVLMRSEIEHCIREQEKLGIDVLVHGEAERNDMVEYFGEQLKGYAFTELGWVQSYGSRCVKPPIIYGDISRPQAMTVTWSKYAQSLTKKPVKGMLTGPVTMLNWSFIRDDQAPADTCLQLALAIREEVLDLEAAGISVIQIDEPALREGLPLRQKQWQHYLNWAVKSFHVSANSVKDETQIHTHMCYSEFNDIMQAIADLDADVITIETSRSDMELLDVFDQFQYPNEIGPGVYDIHSPNIPTAEQMVKLLKKAAEKIPVERLWVNPDCGLKTRQWDEATKALRKMNDAAHAMRKIFTSSQKKVG